MISLFFSKQNFQLPNYRDLLHTHFLSLITVTITISHSSTPPPPPPPFHTLIHSYTPPPTITLSPLFLIKHNLKMVDGTSIDDVHVSTFNILSQTSRLKFLKFRRRVNRRRNLPNQRKGWLWQIQRERRGRKICWNSSWFWFRLNGNHSWFQFRFW